VTEHACAVVGHKRAHRGQGIQVAPGQRLT
jgi:hypothetical protein